MWFRVKAGDFSFHPEEKNEIDLGCSKDIFYSCGSSSEPKE